MINLSCKVEGYYTLTAKKECGSSRNLASFKNMILDGGLDTLGLRDGINLDTVYLSNDNKPVMASDTNIGQVLASTYSNREEVSLKSINEAGDKYIGVRLKWTFSAGSAVGNFSKVGVGQNAYTLFSAALILDANSNPMTISVQNSETLEVTYELRIYIPTQVYKGTITPIGGIDNTVRNWTAKAAAADSVRYDGFGWAMRDNAASNIIFSTNYSGTRGTSKFSSSGISDDIDGRPVDLFGFPDLTTATDAMQKNISFRIAAPVNESNGSIKSILFAPLLTTWQIEFDKPFIKTADDEFSIVLGFSWERK